MKRDPTAAGGKTERIILAATVLCLVYTAVRSLFPVAERPSSAETWLSLAFEIGMTVAVVGLGGRVLRSVRSSGEGQNGWRTLILAGVVAAFVIFAVRISGGPRVELPPRPGSYAQTSHLPSKAEQFVTRVEAVVSGYREAENAALDTVWHKTLPSDQPKLPRAALQEHIAKHRQLVEAVDRILAVLDQPDFSAEIARARAIAQAEGSALPSTDTNRDAWRLLRRMYDRSYRVYTLVDANWDEWRANPEFPTDNLKPWQKEVQALISEIKEADQEHDRLLENEAKPVFQPAVEPKREDAEVAKLKDELKAAHALYKSRWDKLSESRWAQTGFEVPRDGNTFSYAAITPAAIPKLRKLSAADLSEFRRAQRALLDSYDEVFRLFAAASAKNFDPFHVGVDLGGHHRRLENWKASQRVHAIAYAQTEVLEQNWEDWQRRGLPKGGKPKPWQERMRELQSEFARGFADWDAAR